MKLLDILLEWRHANVDDEIGYVADNTGKIVGFNLSYEQSERLMYHRNGNRKEGWATGG